MLKFLINAIIYTIHHRDGLSLEKAVVMSRIIGWSVVAMVLVFLGPVLIIPLMGDVIKITWASMPWWGQLAGIAMLGLVALAVLRFFWWILTGRSTLAKRRY